MDVDCQILRESLSSYLFQGMAGTSLPLPQTSPAQELSCPCCLPSSM